MVQPVFAQAEPALKDFFFSNGQKLSVGKLGSDQLEEVKRLSFYSQIESLDQQHQEQAIPRALAELVDNDGLAKDGAFLMGLFLLLKARERILRISQHQQSIQTCRVDLKSTGKTRKKRKFPKWSLALGSLLTTGSVGLLMKDMIQAYRDVGFDPEEVWILNRAFFRNGRLLDLSLEADRLLLEDLEDLWLQSLIVELKNYTNQSFAIVLDDWRAGQLFEAKPQYAFLVYLSGESEKKVLRLRRQGHAWVYMSSYPYERLSEQAQVRVQQQLD